MNDKINYILNNLKCNPNETFIDDIHCELWFKFRGVFLKTIIFDNHANYHVDYNRNGLSFNEHGTLGNNINEIVKNINKLCNEYK